LAVQCHEDGAQAALGMGSQDAEPLAVGGGRPDGVAGRPVGVIFGAGGELGEGVLDRWVADGRERFAGGSPGGDRGEAPLGRAAVLLQVQPDHGLASMASASSRSAYCSVIGVVAWPRTARATSRLNSRRMAVAVVYRNWCGCQFGMPALL